MGAVFSQRVARAELEELVAWSRKRGCMLVGTSDAALTGYREVRYHPPVVLLMGSEQKGLSAEQQGACDVVACIPMIGRSDSLNLAVATGIMLYEILGDQTGVTR